jgi:hypothetical protein
MKYEPRPLHSKNGEAEKRIYIRRMAVEWAKNKGRTNPPPVAIPLIRKPATLHVLLRLV